MVEKKTEEGISEAEAALYDRQIRLWGLDAQNRLHNARVLLMGLSGLGAEIAKNLMLAGLKSLTLIDSAQVSETDLHCQFLVPQTSLGQNRAEASLERCRALNPLVALETADASRLLDTDFLSQFHLVCLCDQPNQLLDKVDSACRSRSVKFVAGTVRGWFGWGFLDFLDHEFAEETREPEAAEEDADVVFEDDQADLVPETKRRRLMDVARTVKKTEYYCSFGDCLQTDWTTKSALGPAKKLPSAYLIFKSLWKLEQKGEEATEEKVEQVWEETLTETKAKPTTQPKEFFQFLSGQLSPVCAILGGVLGQQIIGAVSCRDQPLNNLFVYNGMDTTGVVCRVPPPLLRSAQL